MRIDKLPVAVSVSGSDYLLLNQGSTPVTKIVEVSKLEDYLLPVSSADVQFLQAGTGAQVRSVQSKLRDVVSVLDFGADPTGVADSAAAFTAAGSAATALPVLVPKGTYLLNSNPAPTGSVTWLVDKGVTFTGTGNLSFLTNKILSQQSYRSLESSSSFYNGIFGYLEQNSALTAYGTLGLHGCVQSAGGTGSTGEAEIAVSAFAAHNLAASAGGVWGLYATVLRASGVNGATHAVEVDVANFGTTVPIYPHAPFQSGLTAGLWVCTGGETTEPSAGGSPGVASVGIAIIQNDAQTNKTAKWKTGILFHNTAIDGADGTGSGIGQAIAFASGHAQQWLNNSAQICAEIVGTATNATNANLRMDFSDFGILFQDRATGVLAFQIVKTNSAANYLQVTSSTTTSAPILSAVGSDTNIDLSLLPKGTGAVRFGTYTAAVSAVAGYIEIKDAAGITRKLAVLT